MKKRCIKCGIEKGRVAFYKHPCMKDGRLGKCKECTIADVKANRLARVDYYREYDRKRGNRQTPEYLKEWQRKNPRKYKANYTVTNAVRDKKLVRLPCEICGAKAHGHHDDYAQPLNVRWLCPAHHKQWHDANGPGINGGME